MPGSQVIIKNVNPGAAKRAGVSLLEVLLSISILSLAILPLMLSMTSASQNNGNVNILATRAMAMHSEIDRLDPDNPSFVAATASGGYDMGTTIDSTSFVDSGHAIPFLRRVDPANSSSMKRRVYFYEYANASDPVSSPVFKSVQDVGVNDLFLDVGLASGSYKIDSAGRTWMSDNNAYDSTNHVPGYVTGNAGSTGSNAAAITNTADDFIYNTTRVGGTNTASLRWSVDVEPGNYVVQLYFAETGGVTNRSMDIYVGDQAMTTTAQITAFNPYTVAGSVANKAVVLSFDVNVASTTKVININVTGNAGSGSPPMLQGISISRR